MTETATDIVPIDKGVAPPKRLSGRLRDRVPSGTRRGLFVLFGLIYVQQLGRVVGWLFGLRTEAELTLEDAAIRVHSRTTLLGTRTRERDELYPLTAVLRMTFERAYGGAFLWAGAGAFVVAVGLAAALLFRARVGFGGSLLLAAFAFLALGLALDVAAYALTQRLAARAKARVELVLTDGRRVTVSGADRTEAQAFLDAVSRRLAPPRTS